MRVAVVGLGVIGAGVARAVAAAGAQVTVFERSGPAAGTTGTSFAWTNSHQKEPLAYHELNVAGMAEHRELAAIGSNWFFPRGNLEWAAEEAGAARLRESTERLVERGYRVEWVTRHAVARLAPDVRLPAGVEEVAYYPDEGYVLPVPLVARLWGEARDRGAARRLGEVREVADGAVYLSNGERHEFDVVVLAVGRWTERLAATAGIEIPMADPDLAGSATVGLLGYTDPVPVRLDLVLTTPRLNVRPDGGGRLVLQGLDLDAGADPAAPPGLEGPEAAELRRRAAALLAGAEQARVTSIRVGQRSLPADGRTVAGFAGERTYLIATHSGITLGPLLGRLAAQEIVRGTPADQLAEFRPNRFAGRDRAELPILRPARFAGQQ